MIYLFGYKFRNILKLSLLKKIISYFFLSIIAALILNNFKIQFQTIQVFLIFWNLFKMSIISRYFIYNRGFNIRILVLYLIYIIALNVQLYINKYLAIILIICLTYIIVNNIIKVLNVDFDFNKAFIEMIFINRANYLARENLIEDRQEFVREVSAEKSRINLLLKNINFKRPLLGRNLLIFSRINLSVSFFIFNIFVVVTILYKFELFEFVKIIKELNLGEPIVAMHQALYIHNIIDLITRQKSLLIEKSKERLYLSYNKYEINKTFILLGVPILFIATLMVGIFLQRSIRIIGIRLLFYSIVFLFS